MGVRQGQLALVKRWPALGPVPVLASYPEPVEQEVRLFDNDYLADVGLVMLRRAKGLLAETSVYGHRPSCSRRTRHEGSRRTSRSYRRFRRHAANHHRADQAYRLSNRFPDRLGNWDRYPSGYQQAWKIQNLIFSPIRPPVQIIP
jgi:hypothetical protein